MVSLATPLRQRHPSPSTEDRCVACGGGFDSGNNFVTGKTALKLVNEFYVFKNCYRKARFYIHEEPCAELLRKRVEAQPAIETNTGEGRRISVSGVQLAAGMISVGAAAAFDLAGLLSGVPYIKLIVLTSVLLTFSAINFIPAKLLRDLEKSR